MERTALGRRDLLRAGGTAAAFATFGGVGSAAADDATTEYAPRGVLDVAGAAEAVVTPDGETAFVAVGSGFASVDLSDPANPTVLAEARELTAPDGRSVQQVFDVKYDDGRLLVPTAAQGAGPRGFYLFDVSDPANPTQVGDWYGTTYSIHNAFLDGRVAYLRSTYELKVVDVAGGSFELLETWRPGYWNEDWAYAPNTVLHDVYVQDDVAYCAYWDAGTFLLDVSDPADPTFLSRVGEYTLEELRGLGQQAYYEPPGNDHYVTVNEDATLMGVGGESWDLDRNDDTGGPSGIALYDVSETANPKRVGHVDPPVSGNNTYNGGTWTTSHNFDLHDGRLYASWYQGGVSVHDVTDPANPERLSWWAAPETRAFWTAQVAVPGEFFVASSYRNHDGVAGGLFTFSDEAGEMADAPSSVAWSEADLPETETSTGRTTAVPTATTAEPTATTVAASETTAAGEATGATSSASAGGSPGFDALAALGGLGLGAARLLRGSGDDDA